MLGTVDRVLDLCLYFFCFLQDDPGDCGPPPSSYKPCFLFIVFFRVGSLRLRAKKEIIYMKTMEDLPRVSPIRARAPSACMYVCVLS